MIKGQPRKPKAGRSPGRFTQSRRLGKLRMLLEGHPGGVPLEDLAGAIHVSTRSVRRYLRELDRVTELESIATVPGGPHLWRIKPSERGRTVQLRRTQAYALLAARHAFDSLKGSALYDEIELAYQNLLQLAQRPGRSLEGDVPPGTHLEDRLLVLHEPARAYAKKSDQLDDLFQAVAQLRVVRLRVEGASIECHPCAIVMAFGAIHCIVRPANTPSKKGDAMRALRLDEIEETKVLDARFSLPEGFDARAWVQGVFGLSPPGPSRRVIVELDAHVAHEVRARKVHPTQRIATAPDGRVRVAVDVPHVEALVGWLLGFGDAARVIEPPDLALRIRSVLDRAVAKYRARLSG
jgi:predicted DNA-binding transcriptional regulator YafY